MHSFNLHTVLSEFTRGVYDAYVTVPPGVAGQDEAGALWDVLTMTRFAILRSRPGCDRLPVALYVRNDNNDNIEDAHPLDALLQ